MTPQQCIDFLVDRVGHERDNATAEVRRSFDGSYGPLYQIAYLIGGLQQYSLHHDLVDAGKMTNRQFNDALRLQPNHALEPAFLVIGEARVLDRDHPRQVQRVDQRRQRQRLLVIELAVAGGEQPARDAHLLWSGACET